MGPVGSVGCAEHDNMSASIALGRLRGKSKSIEAMPAVDQQLFRTSLKMAQVHRLEMDESWVPHGG